MIKQAYILAKIRAKGSFFEVKNTNFRDYFYLFSSQEATFVFLALLPLPGIISFVYIFCVGGSW